MIPLINLINPRYDCKLAIAPFRKKKNNYNHFKLSMYGCNHVPTLKNNIPELIIMKNINTFYLSPFDVKLKVHCKQFFLSIGSSKQFANTKYSSYLYRI